MITYSLKIDVQGERERYENIVFTSGDKRGYRLQFAFYSYGTHLEVSGCALTVKARRADGAVILDSGRVDGQTAYYDVADNAYEIPGEVELEVALTGADGSQVVVSVITAQVRAGFGESGLSSEDNEPVLAKLEAQALQTVGAVNGMRSELDLHKTNELAHTEAFALERAKFNPLYSNALSGSAKGSNITVSDAVEGTPVGLTLYGACTEVLADPSAEKSPDNPATITGIGESGSVTVTQITSKNLFDADTLYERMCEQIRKNGSGPNSDWHKDNVLFDGRNCVKNGQLGMSLSAVMFENGKPNTQYTFKWNQYVDANDGGSIFRAIYSDGSYKHVLPTKHREWETMTLTTEPGKTVTKIIQYMYGSNVYATTYWDKSSMMLNEGATALPYEPYAAQEIVVPLESPLYKFEARPGFEDRPQWSARIDGIGVAKIIRQTEYREFDGTENWYQNGEIQNGLVRYILGYVGSDACSGPRPFICSHFKYDPNYAAGWYAENYAVNYGFSNAPANAWFGICVSAERFPMVDDFKTWLAEQKAAGTPVGFVHTIAPTETDITDTEAGQALLALTAQNGATFVNSEGADMKVEYNRDINKAIEEIKNAVAALGTV